MDCHGRRCIFWIVFDSNNAVTTSFVTASFWQLKQLRARRIMKPSGSVSYSGAGLYMFYCWCFFLSSGTLQYDISELTRPIAVKLSQVIGMCELKTKLGVFANQFLERLFFFTFRLEMYTIELRRPIVVKLCQMMENRCSIKSWIPKCGEAKI